MIRFAFAAVISLLFLASCTIASPAPFPTNGPIPEAGAGPTIGLLLPETATARYESADRPVFTYTVEQRCPECTVQYANAEQDASLQLQQAESMLASGVSVLVLDAVDTVSARTIVANAHRLNVPVIAYDRFLDDVDYYVSFDSQLVGYFMAKSVVDYFDTHPQVYPNPSILIVMGSTTDPNTAALEAGIHRGLADSGINIAATYFTPDWSPGQAALWVESQLAIQSQPIDAVIAANDGLASGTISAFKAAGITPLPLVTGQDGELSAIQRLLTGDQYMTVFKGATTQARTAAEYAVALSAGQSPRTTATVSGVPAVLLTPQPVYAGTVARIVVDGGIYSAEEICTPHYENSCQEYDLITIP